jgi:hypothetical protein
MAAAFLPGSVAEALPAWASSWEAVAAGAVAVTGLTLYSLRRWAAGGKNRYHPSMAGKVVLVTGEKHLVSRSHRWLLEC